MLRSKGLRTLVIVLAVVVSPAAHAARSDPTDAVYIEDADRFPGWKGELPRAEFSSPTIGYGESGQEEWRGQVEQVSWSPRAFVYHNFLSDEECDALIEGVSDHLSVSNVVDSATGKGKVSDVRTSTGAFYGRGSSALVRRIESRIAHISFLPVDHGEGLQILHYQAGQEYKPHNDYFHDKVNATPEKGGQRVATVLMYLSTPEEGGETVFPQADSKVTGSQWSDCARQGLAIKATKGDALLFYSLKPSGEKDPASLHGSCPTTKGQKWSATKWLHVGAWGGSDLMARAKKGECVDTDDRCGEWASAGECEKNRDYMSKYCRYACELCEDKGTSTA